MDKLQKISIMCKEARKESGLSREKASLEMNDAISPDRIEKIENCKVYNTTPGEIRIMSEVYNKPELCNIYCTEVCDIGKKYVRKTEIKDLAHMTIDTLNALNTIESCKMRLLEIVADEKIDEEEMEDFLKIKETLDKIAATADSLKYWMEKENIKAE